MKGKAQNQPNNHVHWANGFKSNMPDWPTARRCAISSQMLYMLKEARTVVFQIERGDVDEIRMNTFFKLLDQTIDIADGLASDEPSAPVSEDLPKPGNSFEHTETVRPAMPPPPRAMPKPPGFK